MAQTWPRFILFVLALASIGVLYNLYSEKESEHLIFLCEYPFSNGKCEKNQIWFDPDVSVIYLELRCRRCFTDGQMSLMWYYNSPEGKRHLISLENFSANQKNGWFRQSKLEKHFQLARIGDTWATGIYEVEWSKPDDNHMPKVKKVFMIL